MILNREEQKMLNGDMGPGVQKSMELLVKVGEACGAERMVNISYAHIISSELNDLLFDLSYSLVEGARARVPLSTNSLILSTSRAKDMDIPAPVAQQWQAPLDKLLKLHHDIGIVPTYTCHPFYLYDLRQGDRLALTESCVAIYANSWFGAMTNIEGQTTALAAAVTGKIPEYGLQLPQNRRGRVLVEIAKGIEPEKFDYSDYGALSYWTSKHLVDRIPVYQGLPSSMGCSLVSAMCYGHVASSSASMFHIVGVTPEAPTLEAALGGTKPEEKLIAGDKELKSAYQALCSAKEAEVDLVVLGCPHCSLEEINEAAELLEGRRISQNVRLWIGTNGPVEELAMRMGLVDKIERAGGFVFSEMCSGTILIAMSHQGLGTKTIATNSVLLADYVLKGTRGKVGAWFGSMKDCIEAAVKGKWEGR
jgi:hypothetical protein